MKRRGRGREEEEKKRSSRKNQRYGSYDFCMELGIDLNRYMLWVVGCEKPNPKMSSCMKSS